MKINLVSLSEKRRPADLLLAGAFEGVKSLNLLRSLEPEFARTAEQALKTKRFSGKKGESLSSLSQGVREAAEIYLTGLGAVDKFNRASLAKTIASLIRLARCRKAKRVRLLFESFLGGKIQAAPAAGIFAEAGVLASYTFDKYKTKKEKDDGKFSGPEVLEILVTKKGAEKNLGQNIQEAQIIAEGTLRARNLVNEPGNVINPQTLVAEARKLAREKGLRLTVLGPADLKRLQMGGILGVNQGSKIPPALIILEYGASHKSKGTVCLVGKGVTFDTGGISIKPSNDMEKMKYDKAGACTVIATMGVVRDLKLPLHVVGLAPAVENMPSENPQRPGDIIRMSNGKTVEVINTDAEGRLILGDALAYAAKYKPKAVIDLATLTGMCVYTFSDQAIGLMGNNDSLLAQIKKAGEETGERCWELPLWDEYGEMIKGHHSDLLNTGGKYAGTITAAMFLKEFIPPKTAWAHLDIAGTAWCDKPRADCPQGATGVGVRLLAHLLKNWK
ncbi:MAG: leucyl aminopeptidase [Candidatus Omnitrophica bacterium]|nr:leucyl aminopeptidase [Candidatus Omnitrophota bacterium]